MFFKNFNPDSTEKFEQDFGDIMSLNEFIQHCENGMFIDYDGCAEEILLNGNIVYKGKGFCPSHVLLHKDELLQKQAELGELQIVWYNR